MIISKSCPCCNSKDLIKSDAILMPFIVKMIFGYDISEIDDSWNLFNVEKGKNYMPCKSVQCQDCELLFCDFRFSDDELTNLYLNYREDQYNKIRTFYEPEYNSKISNLNHNLNNKSNIELFLNDLVSKPVILDYGGHDGTFTPFSESAKDIYIYDISELEMQNDCKKINLNQIKNHSFDLVICSGVLEHVSYPLQILNSIKDHAMNSNTILYIEIPYEKLMINNKNKKNFYEKKRHWHEHINFYSEKSMNKLIENSGLKIIKKQIFNRPCNLNAVNFDNVMMFACKSQ